MLQEFNIALRFMLELCVLGIVGYWGFRIGETLLHFRLLLLSYERYLECHKQNGTYMVVTFFMIQRANYLYKSDME